MRLTCTADQYPRGWPRPRPNRAPNQAQEGKPIEQPSRLHPSRRTRPGSWRQSFSGKKLVGTIHMCVTESDPNTSSLGAWSSAAGREGRTCRRRRRVQRTKGAAARSAVGDQERRRRHTRFSLSPFLTAQPTCLG
jgi:hypothetical protein